MLEAPIRVHRAALSRDSGGPGTHRGGLGGVYEYELLDGEATVTYRGERHLCEAEGVADGTQDGARTSMRKDKPFVASIAQRRPSRPDTLPISCGSQQIVVVPCGTTTSA